MFYFVIVFFFVLIRVVKAILVPISYDEAFSFLVYSVKSISGIFSDYTYPNNHILNTLLMKLSTRLFSDAEFFVRLPSVLGGIIFCVFIYRIANICINRSYLKILYLLLALSNPYLIDINAMGRGYSIGMALGFIAIYYLYQYFDNRYDNSSKTKKIGILLLISICFTLSMGSVPTFVNLFIAVCIAFFIVFLIDKTNNKIKFNATKVAAGFLMVVIPAFILTRLFYIKIHVVPANIPYGLSVKDFANYMLSEFFFNAYTTDVAFTPNMRICNIAKYLLLILFIIGLFRNICTKQKKRLVLYIILAMVIFLTYFESFLLKTRCPFPRNVSYLIPLIYLLFIDFSELIIDLIGKNRKFIVFLASIPLLLLLTVNLIRINFSYFQIYKYHTVAKDMMLIFKQHNLNNIKLSCPFFLDPPIEYYNKRLAMSVSKSDENSCDYILIEPWKEPAPNYDSSNIYYEKYGFRLMKTTRKIDIL